MTFLRSPRWGGAVDEEEASSKVSGDGTQILTESTLEEARLEAHEPAKVTRGEGGDVVVNESVLDAHQESETVPEPEAVVSSGTQVLNLSDEGAVRMTEEGWEEGAIGGVQGHKSQVEDDEDPLDEFPPMAYPQNPVGMGFIACRDERLVEGLELPLIEHPEHPIDGEDLLREMAELLEPGPRPGGFGVVPGGWKPRADHAGVPEEHLEKMEEVKEKRILELDPENEEERMEIQALLDQEVPLFQPEWYNAAVKEWQLDRLDGNEDVVIRNMTEGGTLFFKLPGDHPFVTLDRGRGPESVPMRIDTLSLLVNERQVELVWRGHLPYSGPDELALYTKLELDVVGGAWREEEPKGKDTPKMEGGTQILRLEDLEEEEEASHKSSEEKTAALSLDDVRDDEGTIREDRLGDVQHGDDSWIQEALKRMDEERDEADIEREKTEKEERKAQVASVKERLEEIAAETKKKGSKKKRTT